MAKQPDWKICLFIGSLCGAMLLSGCGNKAQTLTAAERNAKPNTEAVSQNYAEPSAIGSLLGIDTGKRELHLDISDWVNAGKQEVEDRMHAETVPYDEHTIFEDEHGRIRPDSLKKGQKIAVYRAAVGKASTEGEGLFAAQRIQSVAMTREEKLKRLLAHSDKPHTIVLYEEGTIPPYDEKDFEEHVPQSFSGGISWVPYTEGMAVDYKEELGLEKLPVILLFDRKDVLFQTDSMEQLREWAAVYRK